MKKISIIAAVVLAAIMASCGNGTPKANLKTDVDTLSYAFGMSQTQGLKDYLAQREGVDTTFMDEFVKGLNDGANAGDDKKKSAYFAGLRIGQMISQQWVKGINYELFGEDSTQTISLNNLLAGFVAGTLGTEKKYGDWKAECEEFMKKIGKKDGIKKLDKGVYYEVITEGTGATPADTSRVKVNYEGKLINDTIFDSSYQRGEPTTFRCNQVIPGWTEALTHMPVGSTWMVYIPQEQAYAEREAGKIKPFSCLIFKIELVDIEK